jgi:hypothetical protein
MINPFFIAFLLLKSALPGNTAAVAVENDPRQHVIVPVDVPVRDYFAYIDSVVAQHKSTLPYELDEHLLVRANPWIIDTLANTDYYVQRARGVFVYDQKSMVVLRAGTKLYFPTPEQAADIRARQARTVIDVNVPEYRLRVREGDSTVFVCVVRVGRDERKFLKMANANVNLRTHPGTGTIVRHARYAEFIDPVTNKLYEETMRDDSLKTRMPQIPFIEPELNGTRYGQLIHPTTNQATCGTPSSNGCVSPGEADSWRVYYYAPLGTKCVYRYDLEVVGENGEKRVLEDIYGWADRVAVEK